MRIWTCLYLYTTRVHQFMYILRNSCIYYEFYVKCKNRKYMYISLYYVMFYTTCVHIRKPAQVCIHLYLSVPLKVFICFLWFGVRIWLFSDFLHDETVDSFDGFYTPHDQAYPLGRSWKTPQSQSSLSHFSCSCIPDPDSYRSCTYSIWAMTITHFLLPYGLISQQILLLVF